MKNTFRFFNFSASRFILDRILLLAAMLALALNSSAWVYETQVEFIGQGDFDGDGRPDVLVLDKTTGAFRIGYQTSEGILAWADARSSGITNVTGASIGNLLNTARSTLAATSPLANRANLLEAPTGASPALPVSVFLPSIGPNMIAALDVGGSGNTLHDDLYIASSDNPGNRETLIRNKGTAQTVITDSAIAVTRSHGNAFVQKAGIPLRLGLFNRSILPGNDSFVTLNLSNGTVVTEIAQTISDGTATHPEFIAARFKQLNNYSQVLFYFPGNTKLYKWQVTEPSAGTFSLDGPKIFDLGQSIQQAQLQTAGFSNRIVLFFGSSFSNVFNATVYDFDGENAPVAVQSFTNATGFSGCSDLGNGNLSLLFADNLNRTSGYQTWMAKSGGYKLLSSGTLPEVNPYASTANILLFTGEPLVNPNARPLKTLKAGDWSSKLTLSGGSPPSVTATSERYGGISNGLQNPTVLSLGTAPSGVTHGLANQYTNPISIFSRRSASGDLPAEVSISPVSGEYAQAIEIRLTVNVSGWTPRYRLATGLPWQTYTGPIILFTNATVDYFANESGGTRSTAIQSSRYRFIKSGGQMDSDGDGVPDAVEVAYGLDPIHSGADSDGDGHTDLEEILRGTSPTNKLSFPSGFPTFDFGASFDLITTPRAMNAAGAQVLSITNSSLYAWSLGGAALAKTTTTNYSIAGVTNPAAWLRSLVPGPADKLIVQATDFHFDVNVAGSDTRLGRELIGFFPAPKITVSNLPPVNLALGAGAVSAWVSAAGAYVGSLQRPTYIGDLTYRDTLAAALLEAKASQILITRGTNAATNLTLFPFRSIDAGRFSLTAEQLSGIERYVSPILPAYKLTTLHKYFTSSLVNPPSAEVLALRNLASQLCQISAAYNNSSPGAFKLPLDEFRHFIKYGNLNTAYLSRLANTNILTDARNGVVSLLNNAPPRPITNLTLKAILATPASQITFKDVVTDTPVTLWDNNGNPFELPANFEVLPNSQFSIVGHPDIATGTPGLSVEVISLFLTSVPLASDTDSDGNLLVDSWEGALLGGPASNPFGDDDGDGYSNLQEMLAGTDPKSYTSRPAVAPASFSLPNLGISLLGPSTKIIFKWPAMYLSSFKFGMKTATTLNAPFTDMPIGAPVNLGGDRWEINFAPPPADARFYYLTIGLR